MEKKSQDFSIQDAMNLAKSPAGQQLLTLLRQADQDTLQKAMAAANAGDYAKAARTLNSVITPQMRKIAKDLEG